MWKGCYESWWQALSCKLTVCYLINESVTNRLGSVLPSVDDAGGQVVNVPLPCCRLLARLPLGCCFTKESDAVCLFIGKSGVVCLLLSYHLVTQLRDQMSLVCPLVNQVWCACHLANILSFGRRVRKWLFVHWEITSGLYICWRILCRLCLSGKSESNLFIPCVLIRHSVEESCSFCQGI